MGEDAQPAKIDETRTLATDEGGKAVEAGDPAEGEDGDGEATPEAAEDEG